MNTRILLASCLVFVLVLPLQSAAYEGKSTHNAITEAACQQSVHFGPRMEDLLLAVEILSLRDLFGTANVRFYGDPKSLLMRGSINEDYYPGMANTFSHFHDAVTNKAAPLPTFPSSAMDRAVGNDELYGWDWIDAREYFRLGLISSTSAEREENLGRMFYSLGRIAHLLQDMAVPAHVRNDLHLPVNWQHYYVEKNLYEQYWNYSPTTPATTAAPYSFSRLTDFWDGDLTRADYEHPDRGHGLAEFTNRHFFSQDTNLCDEHPYVLPDPLESGCSAYTMIEAPRGELISVDYYRCTFEDHTDNRPFTIQHMTALSLFDFELAKKTFFGQRVFTLNNRCFEDYGNVLIPKAIRYTAGLFDYFFRGSFEAPADQPLVETIAPDVISLHVKNASGEAMTNGMLYLYQDDGDEDVPGAENRLMEYPFTAPISSWADGETFQGDEFQERGVWIPEGKRIEDITFTLVFVGQLGNEQGAVVARRFRVDPGLSIEQVGQTFGSQGEAQSVTFKIVNLTGEIVLAAGSSVEFFSPAGGGTASLSADLLPGGEGLVTFPIYLPYGVAATGTITVTAIFAPGYTRTYTGDGYVGEGRM